MIIVRAASQRVIAGISHHDVLSGSAVGGVGPVAAIKRVIAGVAVENIVPGISIECVIASVAV